MNIELRVNELDSKMSHKLPIIERLSKQMKDFFLNKNYGSSVENFVILCILVKSKQGIEDLFKERKPTYVDYKLYKNKLTGQVLEIKNRYTIEFRIDKKNYDEFAIASDDDSVKILASLILESFKHLDKLPKKITDFDKEKFKVDINVFLGKIA